MSWVLVAETWVLVAWVLLDCMLGSSGLNVKFESNVRFLCVECQVLIDSVQGANVLNVKL